MLDIGLDSHIRDMIAPPILRPSSPAVPPLRRCVYEPYGRVMIQRRNLQGKLVLQPHIVGVEKRDQLAACMTDSEIAGRRHASVLAARVLEHAHPPRRSRARPPGRGTARVGGTVIDEQQFPVLECLREDAFDRFAEERLGVPERDDHGNARCAPSRAIHDGGRTPARRSMAFCCEIESGVASVASGCTGRSPRSGTVLIYMRTGRMAVCYRAITNHAECLNKCDGSLCSRACQSAPGRIDTLTGRRFCRFSQQQRATTRESSICLKEKPLNARAVAARARRADPAAIGRPAAENWGIRSLNPHERGAGSRRGFGSYKRVNDFRRKEDSNVARPRYVRCTRYSNSLPMEVVVVHQCHFIPCIQQQPMSRTASLNAYRNATRWHRSTRDDMAFTHITCVNAPITDNTSRPSISRT